MTVYAIFENEIHDEEAYARFKTGAKPLVEAAGGKYLTRDGAVHVIAGDWKPGRVVIFQWPDMATMKAFLESEEYRPWKELRESVTTTKTLVVVEGDADDD